MKKLFVALLILTSCAEVKTKDQIEKENLEKEIAKCDCVITEIAKGNDSLVASAICDAKIK